MCIRQAAGISGIFCFRGLGPASSMSWVERDPCCLLLPLVCKPALLPVFPSQASLDPQLGSSFLFPSQQIFVWPCFSDWELLTVQIPLDDSRKPFSVSWMLALPNGFLCRVSHFLSSKVTSWCPTSFQGEEESQRKDWLQGHQTRVILSYEGYQCEVTQQQRQGE